LEAKRKKIKKIVECQGVTRQTSLPSVCPMALGKGWNPIFKKNYLCPVLARQHSAKILFF
jgi:hypothetical protein